MAATVRVSYYGESAGEPAGANAESGIAFNVEDDQDSSAGDNPIEIPDNPGTTFSYIKLLALEVTGTDSTMISDRKVYLDDDPAAGLAEFFAQQATYRRPAGTNRPANDGSNGATPTPAGAGAPGSYTELTTTPQGYDSGADSAGSTGRSGDFVELVVAVSGDFAGGAGEAALPDLKVSYIES